MRFDFGKHDGRDVRDVPTSYLQWCLKEIKDLGFLLHEAIRAELASRGHGPARAEPPRQQQQSTGQVIPLTSLRLHVLRWFSELSKEWHPDRGGHPTKMVALNEAHERLKRILGV